MTPDEITITVPKYFKAEEHRVETHEEATTLADKLFQGFATEQHQPGDRTTKEAKVRIRARPSLGDFRVVLYRAINGAKNVSVSSDDTTEEGASSDDAHSGKKSKGQRKKVTKEAARTRGK